MTKDLRPSKITLILFNVANAMIVGFALGKVTPLDIKVVGAVLLASSISLTTGVAFAIFLAWRNLA
jgi:hypothetical protein